MKAAALRELGLATSLAAEDADEMLEDNAAVERDGLAGLEDFDRIGNAGFDAAWRKTVLAVAENDANHRRPYPFGNGNRLPQVLLGAPPILLEGV